MSCFNWATASLPWKPAHGREMRRAARASIGPRHRCRGNCPWAEARPTRIRCFNWATASLPWKPATSGWYASGARPLQLGHGIAAVETAIATDTGADRSVASIGPRHRCRGNSRSWDQCAALTIRFNWATASLPWKRPRNSARRTSSRCFNWATASLPWKPRKASTRARAHAKLQLGHCIAAVETRERLGALRHVEGASIGPRHRCRGNLVDQMLGNTAGLLQLGHGIAAVETTPGSRSRPYW